MNAALLSQSRQERRDRGWLLKDRIFLDVCSKRCEQLRMRHCHGFGSWASMGSLTAVPTQTARPIATIQQLQSLSKNPCGWTVGSCGLHFCEFIPLDRRIRISRLCL